jgi:hypothetical protein
MVARRVAPRVGVRPVRQAAVRQQVAPQQVALRQAALRQAAVRQQVALQQVAPQQVAPQQVALPRAGRGSRHSLAARCSAQAAVAAREPTRAGEHSRALSGDE